VLANTFILAQRHGFDLNDLVYVLILVLTTLGGLGKWLRERSARRNAEVELPESEEKPVAPSVRRPPSARRLATAPPARSVRLAKAKPKGEPVVMTPIPWAPTAPPEPAMPVPRAKPVITAPHRPEERSIRGSQPAAVSGRETQTRRSRPEKVQAPKKQMESKPQVVPSMPGLVAAGEGKGWTAAQLRRAIVMNEVLGLPVALR
jgi:hypothetical protein